MYGKVSLLLVLKLSNRIKSNHLVFNFTRKIVILNEGKKQKRGHGNQLVERRKKKKGQKPLPSTSLIVIVTFQDIFLKISTVNIKNL